MKPSDHGLVDSSCYTLMNASFELRSVQQANMRYSNDEPMIEEKKKMYAHTAQSRSNLVIW